MKLDQHNSASVARRLFASGSLFLLGFVTQTRADLLSFFSHDLDVVTITDMKPKGKKLPPVSPKNPVYYEGINAGFKDWGQIVAGDKIPPNKRMQDMVVRALGKNGYRSADSRHAASQILVMSWGTFYQGSFMVNPYNAMKFLGGDKVDLTGEAQGDIFSLGGGNNMVRAVPNLGQSKLKDFASGDLYVVLIRAYDIKEVEKGKIEELWETRIACPSTGLALDQTLPRIVEIATPNIGRDTGKPVFWSAAKDSNADVQIGDAQVVEYIDVDHVHVTDINELLKPDPKPVQKTK